MAFCIECGTKAPELAKFCPKCGMALVSIEPVSEAANPPVDAESEIEKETTPEAVEVPEIEEVVDVADDVEIDETEIILDAAIAEETDIKLETAEPAPDNADTETGPSAAASLAATAASVETAPKSKAGLFIGLSLIALIAAGGGAYALGLFGGGDKDAAQIVAAPTVPTPAPQTETIKIETSDANPVLKAYQEAIMSGRISDLGQFAKDYPKNSLAKDAEAAAFESLQRQSSVLAFNTFRKYFPEADLSSYTGLREGSAEGLAPSASSGVTPDLPVTASPVTASPVTSGPAIRYAITQRAAELDPFIDQGDIGYAVSVIDEMLGQTDLNEAEATYLLNLRARAETSLRLDVPAEATFVQPDTAEPEAFEPAPAPVILERVIQPCWDGSVPSDTGSCPVQPAPIEIEPAPDLEVPIIAAAPDLEPEAEPETEVADAADIADPDLPYDTAAKAVERRGAEVPEAATQAGACDMFFDVPVSGSPTNIDASCSDPLFVAPAKAAVSDWVYEPALLNGVPVQQNDLQVKIRFNLE